MEKNEMVTEYEKSFLLERDPEVQEFLPNIKWIQLVRVPNPTVLITKLEKLENRRGKIQLVKIYKSKNKSASWMRRNQLFYIRMVVVFESGKEERYYLTDLWDYSNPEYRGVWRNS